MLASISSVVPRDLRTWPTAGPQNQQLFSSPTNPAAPTTTTSSTTPSAQSSRRSPAGNTSAQPQTPLSILQASEAAMAARKTSIRRFGATWLRPAGISKTLQALDDEEAERNEVAEAERRARVLAEETAAAQAAADAQLEQGRMRAGLGGEGAMDVDGIGDAVLAVGEGGVDLETLGLEGVVEEVVERDLDDEVPEAMEASFFDEEEEEGEGMEVDGGEDQVDLDADVPDAGSYQHTDTEVEDSSESEEVDAAATPEVGRSGGLRGGLVTPVGPVRDITMEGADSRNGRRPAGRRGDGRP